MAPNEEGKAASDQLFGSYMGAPNENSVRRWWITLGIGICVATFVVVCLIEAEFHLRPTPYDDIVGRLHPGMSVSDVVEKLGKTVVYRAVYKADGEQPPELEYRTDGVTQPLIIKFSQPPPDDTITEWCFNSDCHKVK